MVEKICAERRVAPVLCSFDTPLCLSMVLSPDGCGAVQSHRSWQSCSHFLVQYTTPSFQPLVEKEQEEEDCIKGSSNRLSGQHAPSSSNKEKQLN